MNTAAVNTAAMTTADVPMLSFAAALLGALLVAMLLGYMAQDTGLCLVRGVNEAKSGRPALLASILLCGVMLWLFVPLAAVLNAHVPFARHAVDPLFAAGGLLFGIGAAINRGCAVSTLSRLARGDLRMALTMLGWPIGYRLWTALMPGLAHAPLSAPGSAIASVTVLIALLVSAWALSGPAAQRSHWLRVMLFGALAGLLFLIEPHWSPSDYVRDVGRALTGGALRMELPGLTRTALIIAVLAGMAYSAVRRGSFAAHRVRIGSALVHLGAGLAMGAGGALAMGGNDAQLLTGLPALSPGALVTVLAMLAGIVAADPFGRWLERRKFV